MDFRTWKSKRYGISHAAAMDAALDMALYWPRKDADAADVE